MKKLEQSEILLRFKKVHGDKYNYSKVHYINSNTKVEIICPEHGSFFVTPADHIRNKSQCPNCKKTKKLIIEEVIKRFRSVHGNKYNYDKVKYINTKTKVEIICPVHGSFFQRPNNHLFGNKCPNCKKTKKLTKEEVLQKFRFRHKDKYNYDKIIYKNVITKVEIICPIHGSFFQKPENHISGSGCPKCGNELTKSKNKNTVSEFIKRARDKHGSKYDYSKVKYINNKTKVEIICPVHGSFFQKPSDHNSGNGSGCQACAMSESRSKGEIKIRNFLKKNNIKFTEQKRFRDCKYKKELPFDFYLNELNILIEYDGQLHYKAVNYFGGEKTLLEVQKRDTIKTNYAEQKNIKLIRIPYWDFINIENILKTILS